MKQGTNQELFDYCYQELVKQGTGSAEPSGHCFYRGPNGTRCAVGLLIDDSEYSEEFERVAAQDLEIVQKFYPEQMYFLRSMQQAHDNAVTDPEGFLVGLRHGFLHVAKSWALNTTVLEGNN